MTPGEVAEYEAQAAARAAARAKWSDSAAVIEDDDLKHFTAPELMALADAGRLTHMHIGPDKRLRR
jgi:hypothetical protein